MDETLCYVYDGSDIPGDVKKKITSFTIAEGVTVIKDCAFWMCTALVSIDGLSSTAITEIGEGAFKGCISLTTLDGMPSTLTKIGVGAFQDCRVLESIEGLGSTAITEIGAQAFQDCRALESMNGLSSTSITEIETQAFKGCTALTTLEGMPSTLTKIGEEAFSSCTSLTTLEGMPSTLTKIGKDAFLSCTALVSIDGLSSTSITEIGERAFKGCTALTTLNGMPSTLVYLKRYAFQACTALVSIEGLRSTSIRKIGEGVFEGCNSLTTLDGMPSTLTKIGERAFRSCTALESFDGLSSSLITKIEFRAFEGCSALTTLVGFPSTLTEIVEEAFLNCTALISAQLPPSIDVRNDLFGGSKLDKMAKAAGGTVLDFLEHRSLKLPLHSLCEKLNVTIKELQREVEHNSEAIKTAEPGSNLLPLHLLCCNRSLSVEVFRFIVDLFPLALKAKEIDGKTPLGLAADSRLSSEVQAYLFGCHPQENPIYAQLGLQVVKKLASDSANPAIIVSPARLNGWVEIISSADILAFPDLLPLIVDMIYKCSRDSAEILANAVDLSGRKALGAAVLEINRALLEQLRFMGRYELDIGPPIHKSATCVVIKSYDEKAEVDDRELFRKLVDEDTPLQMSKEKFASVLDDLGIRMDKTQFDERFKVWDVSGFGYINEEEFVNFCKTEIDNGQRRTCVIKFMKNEDQFLREVKSREENELDTCFVLGVNHTFDGSKALSASGDELQATAEEVEAAKFLKALKVVGLDDYKFALVMPGADRNLDTIFRSERPDINAVRAHSQQVGEAIQHMHEHGRMIHGDLKLLNVVRYRGRLRLIDLDASSYLSDDDTIFYAGAKFSSGVLPPEMIYAATKGSEVETFNSYFSETKETDPELWKKIAPAELKKGRKKTNYVIKTFLTSRVDDEEQPLNKDDLPYSLVEATPAIDLWSFGTILYALVVGEPLFETNRDDDLKGAASMAEVATWSDSNKMDKLKSIPNPIVKDLLSRLLSADVSKRFQSMQEVLDHDFYTGSGDGGVAGEIKKLEESLNKKFEEEHKAFARLEEGQKMVLENTVELKKMSEAMTNTIGKSTSVLCKAIFEATEVSTPTCFVVLPYMLPNPKDEVSEESRDEMLGAANEWVSTVLDLADGGLIEDPKSFALSYLSSAFKGKMKAMKSKYVEKILYLYLVDEYTQKPVYDESKIFPIQMPASSELVEKHMPIMKLGLQAMALTNGVASIANIFCPFVPRNIVPTGILEKAQNFVDGLNQEPEYGEEEEGGKGGGGKRGSALREFVDFLAEKDEKSGFSGLRRVCSKEEGSEGQAIWVTVESAAEIESDSNTEANEWKKEVMSLRAGIERMKKLISTGGAEGSSSTIPAKLRDEVRAAR
jgi:serine/threonine protein kinase